MHSSLSSPITSCVSAVNIEIFHDLNSFLNQVDGTAVETARQMQLNLEKLIPSTLLADSGTRIRTYIWPVLKSHAD